VMTLSEQIMINWKFRRRLICVACDVVAKTLTPEQWQG